MIMVRTIILSGIAALLFLPDYASGNGSEGDDDAILALCGASSVEELDEYELERFRSFLRRPLEINLSTRGRLLSSGLLSQYQVAALLDYRSTCGDVLSVAELSAVDGFGAAARALAPFVSFSSSAPPGTASTGRKRTEVSSAARTALRIDNPSGPDAPPDCSLSWGARFRCELSGRLSVAAAANGPYGAPRGVPDNLSFHLAYSGLKHLDKLVVGDFSLRCGQGLALWDGLQMSSLGGTAALVRNPTGIVPYWSFSGGSSRRGAAAQMSFGRFQVSTSLSAPYLREAMSPQKTLRQKSVAKICLAPAANLAYFWRTGQVGVTAYLQTLPLASLAGEGDMPASGMAAKSSGGLSTAVVASDLRWCIRGTDLFTEAAFDAVSRRFSAVAGTGFRAASWLRMAFRTQYTGEKLALCLIGDWKAGAHSGVVGAETYCDWGTLAATVSRPGGSRGIPRHQTRIRVDWRWDLPYDMCLKLRTDWRHRNWDVRSRLDARLDFVRDGRPWYAASRLECVSCGGAGLLGFVEGGFRPAALSLYLRLGLFRIDSWDERIWVYERDAPCSFNVPALSGRGLWSSLYLSWKFCRWGSLYLRASTTQYPRKVPGASSGKKGKTEVKLQLSIDLTSWGF